MKEFYEKLNTSNKLVELHEAELINYFTQDQNIILRLAIEIQFLAEYLKHIDKYDERRMCIIDLKIYDYKLIWTNYDGKENLSYHEILSFKKKCNDYQFIVLGDNHNSIIFDFSFKNIEWIPRDFLGIDEIYGDYSDRLMEIDAY